MKSIMSQTMQMNNIARHRLTWGRKRAVEEIWIYIKEGEEEGGVRRRVVSG